MKLPNQNDRMENSKQTTDREETIFLPDFCGIRIVFTVVVVAELLAFTILLTTPLEQHLSWDKLGMISLFIQWIALSSAAMLCISRKWLIRFNDTMAGYVSYLIVLVVTLLVSEIAYWSIEYMGLGKKNDWHLDFLMRNMGISAILGGIILRFIFLQYQQKMHMQAHADARIQALQARIRPHFLFNSMNTIAALIRSQPGNAEEAVEDLADLFRASLNEGKQLVSMAGEIDNVRRYLHIEELRLGDRLKVSWQLQEIPMDAQIPVLALQPLLENAIYHGIEMLPDGGEIQVCGKRQDDWLNITITNPCLPPEQSIRTQGNKMAIKNINERLMIAFGPPSGLKLNRQEKTCQLDIIFPYRTSE